MDFVRIGDKLISPGRIDRIVRQVLKLRSEGMSQQEVADRLNLERTFISRLETLGSIRRGGRMGLLAFPVANREELQALAGCYGVDECLVLSNRERWELVEQKSGLDFLNYFMAALERFRNCDMVLVLCSGKWNRLAEALLDTQVLAVEIGTTPIKSDVYVDPAMVESILQQFACVNDAGRQGA